MRGLTGSLYGRRMYEVMRYWDEDLPEWVAEEREFAAGWRSQPKWVVSRSLKSVGPNATLVEDDLEAAIRGLKAQRVREIGSADQTWREACPTLVLLMSIDSTSTPSCWVAASHSSSALGRRSA